jgi:hypothetical protein
MSAWQTPARDAEDALRAEDYRSASPRDLAETVINQLAEPDAEMLDAGAREIEDAFPIQIPRRARRNLAGKIWRAMFDRVQR